ncbi:hypothetical protein L3Y34_015870 [Caenorhabditis briggsae]|uniref:Anaphase-promoting complex subunit 4-like WD40 domain-containing protein n=1 Tax=Caenorhabditis briggsae TaxID=6238 RepID=A0AAE9IZJ2_CAEBR|nr:hypothetical protein L3Y34_015870 [Caenorhabditis briggsae]
MDDSMNDEDIPKARMVGKYEKAHNRSLVGVWSFRFGGQIGVISVSHENSKLWILCENRAEDSIFLDEKMILTTSQTAIQSADVSVDGQYVVMVGLNSTVYEVELINSVKTMAVDFDYLEATFCAVQPKKTGYITAAYSGFLKEIRNCSKELVRQEAFPGVRQISCLKFSRDGKYLAVGQLDGGIEMLHSEDLKSYHKYEVHSMRIRKIEFLPGDERFLSGCEDRLIKLHSMSDFAHEADPTRSTKAVRVYSAHDAPVTGLTIDEKSGGTRFASASSSSQIFIWHIELTTPIMSIVNDHTSAIAALSFSPTSRHLLSGGDEGMLQIFNIPGVGEESPQHMVFYPTVEQAKAETEHLEDPYYQQENEPPSDYSQSAAESQQYYTQQGEEASDYQPEDSSTAQYQEYNPYAEPRTPPQEEEDIGDYVYNTTVPVEQNGASPQSNEYNPEV